MPLGKLICIFPLNLVGWITEFKVDELRPYSLGRYLCISLFQNRGGLKWAGILLLYGEIQSFPKLLMSLCYCSYSLTSSSFLITPVAFPLLSESSLDKEEMTQQNFLMAVYQPTSNIAMTTSNCTSYTNYFLFTVLMPKLQSIKKNLCTFCHLSCIFYFNLVSDKLLQ